MELDFSRCRQVPVRAPDGTISMSSVKEHAKIGVKALVENPFFALLDEMGGMKTAQTIIAAQFLFEQGTIDRVLVVAPASVRPVWYDQELGELARHLFIDKARVYEFHARIKEWKWGEFTSKDKVMEWWITNYEFIRSKDRQAQIEAACTPKTLLVLDESSAVKSHRTQQTKACLELRKKCGRVVLLNGTPVANSPMDMYSQGNIMSGKILASRHEPNKNISYFQFRSRYAIMGGFLQKQIISYQNLEDLQARFKPYVLRRLKKDCLDLPPALPPVTLTVALTPETWKIYKQMRDDLVAWLSDSTTAVASQAAVKSMRLAQITSGFVGGVEEAPDLDEAPEDFMENPPMPKPVIHTISEVGREKLDFLMKWHEERLEEDPNMKLLVFCRFIPELERMLNEYKRVYPNHSIGCCAGRPLLGGRKKDEREQVLRLLDPRTAPPGPVTVGGTLGAGGLGHNFTACHTMVNLSQDYSTWKSDQAAARIDRPGQVHSTSFFDIVAVGPNGQKTIDHIIVKQKRGKADINNWTMAEWVKNLTEE